MLWPKHVHVAAAREAVAASSPMTETRPVTSAFAVVSVSDGSSRPPGLG